MTYQTALSTDSLDRLAAYVHQQLADNGHVPDFPGGPPAYNYLRSVLEPLDIEGIVFYGPGGLMAKCTKSGLKLPRLCEVKL